MALHSYSCLTPIGSHSARSGLPVYRPDSEFRDVTVGVTLAHQFNDRWGALLRASATRYVGDTADSPIIHEGSKTVGLVGVAASYRF
jgi:outer membrane scaffolding protein for murein synthesis (MipA/OmpV family)